MRTGRGLLVSFPSGAGTLLVQERNVFRRFRVRDALDISVDVGEFLVGHDLGAKRRHPARRRIAHESSEGDERQTGLGEARSRSASLPHVTVALIAPVPLEK